MPVIYHQGFVCLFEKYQFQETIKQVSPLKEREGRGGEKIFPWSDKLRNTGLSRDKPFS